MSVRVRFAPSPTGHMHVGNARTALFNYLYAHSIGGTFVLRIEDTDLDRSTKDSEKLIFEDMQWLGLNWDEGEGKSGKYGPYRQTERFHLYDEVTSELLQAKKAYKCFCTKETLEYKRQKFLQEGKPPLYDRACLNLTEEEIQQKIEAGEKYSIRFKVRDSDVLVDDIIHGVVKFPTSSFGDFIIVRPDGVPVYNFAVVIDDYSMAITHVIRGDDHLSNTPKQILIYEALGKDVPKFAHIPMILGPDRSKLSKRHGNTSIAQFKEEGYLPEALVNFMTLLSWSDEEGKEIFSLEESIKNFTLDRVSSSPAIFDFDKLKWINGLYIRSEKIEKITQLVLPYLIDAGVIESNYYDKNKIHLEKIVLSIRDNLEVLKDVVRYTEVYFKDNLELDNDSMAILTSATAKKVLEAFYDHLERKETNNILPEEYKQIVKEVQKLVGVKGKDLYMPIRVGVTCKVKGPELDQFIPLMNKDLLLKRIEFVLKNIPC